MNESDGILKTIIYFNEFNCSKRFDIQNCEKKSRFSNAINHMLQYFYWKIISPPKNMYWTEKKKTSRIVNRLTKRFLWMFFFFLVFLSFPMSFSFYSNCTLIRIHLLWNNNKGCVHFIQNEKSVYLFSIWRAHTFTRIIERKRNAKIQTNGKLKNKFTTIFEICVREINKTGKKKLEQQSLKMHCMSKKNHTQFIHRNALCGNGECWPQLIDEQKFRKQWTTKYYGFKKTNETSNIHLHKDTQACVYSMW